MAYAATIVADSISRAGDRLTTMVITFPRMVLAEFNTHRMFSRNSASSRAIPVEKQLARILEDPFIPVYWGKNQSGMQATVELDAEDRAKAEEEWLKARDYAIDQVQILLNLKLHKQLANRLLEPFMWHTVVVTATEWSNFFALRTHKDAQPEIRVIAEMMQELYLTNVPTLVEDNAWHLPFIQPDEYDGRFEYSKEACMVSTARCARVSYLTHDGKRDHSEDLRLYERLVSGGHMSPLEHVATPVNKQYVSVQEFAGDSYGRVVKESVHYEIASNTGNFRGWEQFRKYIPNESDYSLVSKEE